MRLVVVLLFLFFTVGALCQSTSLPPNPKPGMCYVRCMDENNKVLFWNEIDCKLLMQSEEEIKDFQRRLKNKGADIDVTGKIDAKTIAVINATSKVSKKKKKKKRKAKRKRRSKNDTT